VERLGFGLTAKEKPRVIFIEMLQAFVRTEGAPDRIVIQAFAPDRG
jgi:hypothetical protein